MKRIRNSRIILLFIFLAGVSLVILTDLAYCSTEELIGLIKETYNEWKRENPELATAFREEVDNLKVIERERLTERNPEKLETLEEVSQQAAETKQGLIDGRKLTPSETTTSGSSGGGGKPPAPPNPQADTN